MNGVAAEVAEEIFVLFEDRNRHPLACEQVPEHDASGSAPDNAAFRP
jgi:hypothetical protein